MSMTTSAARAASMRSSANGLPCRRITRARMDSGTTYLCIRRACRPAGVPSILGEVPFDQRRDLVRARPGEIVIAFAHDMESRIGQPLREMLAYCQRADRVGITPQQQGRRSDALDRQRLGRRSLED